MNVLPLSAVLLALALMPATVFARTSDRNKPMDIDAGKSDYSMDDSRPTVLSGGVIITQGTLEIRADQAVITSANGDPVRVVLTGSPVTLKQELDDGKQMDAVAKKVDYDLKTEIVVFTGSVNIRQPSGSIAGERVVYNMRTGGAGRRPGHERSREDPHHSEEPGGRLMLVAQGLRKAYRSREVVKDFGLTLDAGEVVGLLGPNGAGKTTCFYMIVGLVPADAGQIVLDGKDITSEPMYARAKYGVGYLPQEPSVFRKLSVADNIRLVLELREDLDRNGRDRELDSLLDELQVGHVADQIGASLSGGERRRVEIARALAARPRLMLLDEPFAGVDPISVGEIQRIVSHLKNRGIGVLITDHNVRETLGICDRAYILNEGGVLAQGAPDALLANPDVRRVYLGETFRL